MAIYPLRRFGERKEVTWLDDDRPSGIPSPGRLGAARREMIYLALGLVVFALILIGFWYEATH